MPERVFSGYTALVTGAASGIGAAIARGFAAEGAVVLLADVQTELGEQLASNPRAQGGRATFVKCDMQNEDDIKSAVRRAVEDFGALHIAFNNAGIEGKPAPTAECTNENWNHVINGNLRGVWLCMKHEIPAMLAGGRLNRQLLVDCRHRRLPQHPRLRRKQAWSSRPHQGGCARIHKAENSRERCLSGGHSNPDDRPLRWQRRPRPRGSRGRRADGTCRAA